MTLTAPAPAPPTGDLPPREHRARREPRRPRVRRAPSHARIVGEAGLLGLLLGALVVAPWVGHGYLVLLDWVSGPHDTLDPGVFGLAAAGLDALPWRLATAASRSLLGADVTAWLFVVLPFPVAAAGAAHLVGRGRLPAYAAALALTCTPLVVDRVEVGHVSYLLAIALLPWLAASALHAQRQQRWFSARTTGWLALSVAVSPHAAWIGGALLLAVLFSSRPTRRDLVRVFVTVVTAAGVYAYAISVLLANPPRLQVSSADLEAFATREGPGGLLPTVLTLHGFWRGGEGQVREVMGPAGWLLALVLLGTVGYGIVSLLRRRDPLGRVAATLVVLGAVLAVGAQGPVGDLYQLAFERVPLFAVMREPAKWLALVQLGYAIGLAGGVQAASRWADRQVEAGRSRPLLVAPVALALAPLLMLPALALGVGGRVQVSDYPDSWAVAERITSEAPGQVLALPWHGYQPYTFTGGRSVATVEGSYLSSSVLQSDAVELGPLRTNSTSLRQATVDRWVARGGEGGTEVLADLGVRWILLTRGAEDASYAWVGSLTGIRSALATSDLQLWEVTASRDVVGRLSRGSQAHYVVAAGAPGRIVVPEEYDAGWTLDGVPGRPTASGAIEFTAAAGPADIVYEPWALIRVGAAISVAVLLALLVAGLVEHRRDLPIGRRARRTP